MCGRVTDREFSITESLDDRPCRTDVKVLEARWSDLEEPEPSRWDFHMAPGDMTSLRHGLVWLAAVRLKSRS